MMRSTTITLGLLLPMAAWCQCAVGTPCDDQDSCTVGDVLTNEPGFVECAYGFAEIPSGITVLDGTTLSPEDRLRVSPFLHEVPLRRYRQQFMYLREELDVTSGSVSIQDTIAYGLGDCQPVTSIAFYLEESVQAEDRHLWLAHAILLKHAYAEVEDLSLGFDNSYDSTAACNAHWGFLISMPLQTNAPGWYAFPLDPPFLWDGVRDVILEVAVDLWADSAAPAPLPVRYVQGTLSDTEALLSCVAVAPGPYAPLCTPIPSPVGCQQQVPASALTSQEFCMSLSGPSNLRPVIRLEGGVDTSFPDYCNCGGQAPDGDGDGLPDCEDPCIAGANPGEPCDDGDDMTFGDVVNADCSCDGFAVGQQEELRDIHPLAWPVPCSGILFLAEPMSGSVMDDVGRRVMSFSRATRLDLGALAPGTYLFRAADNRCFRLVKE